MDYQVVTGLSGAFEGTREVVSIDRLAKVVKTYRPSEERTRPQDKTPFLLWRLPGGVIYVSKALLAETKTPCKRCDQTGKVPFAKAGGVCFQCHGQGSIVSYKLQVDDTYLTPDEDDQAGFVDDPTPWTNS